MDSCITDKINDPCSQLDKIIAGDIVKINTKYYYFISKEKGNMLCKNITNHKQVTIPDNNVEIIVRPYSSCFINLKVIITTSMVLKYLEQDFVFQVLS